MAERSHASGRSAEGAMRRAHIRSVSTLAMTMGAACARTATGQRGAAGRGPVTMIGVGDTCAAQ